MTFRLWRQRKWPWFKECGQPLEAREQELDSLIGPAEGNAALQTLWFLPVETRVKLWIYITISEGSKTGKWLGLRNNHNLECKQDYLPAYLSACLLHPSLSRDYWLSLLLQWLCLYNGSWELLNVLYIIVSSPRETASLSWLYFQNFCTRIVIVCAWINHLWSEEIISIN